MLRYAVLGVVVLVQFGLIKNAGAQSQDVLAAGRPILASIDANQNNIPDDPEDCNLMAEAQPTGPNSASLNVFGEQDAEDSDKLRPCLLDCGGSGFVSSDFAEVQLSGCDNAGAPFVPMIADFCETPEMCNSTSTASASGSAAGQITQPINIRAGAVFRVLSGERSGFGEICSAGGGPVAEITGDDGLTVLREFFPYPDAEDPTHQCVPDFPVQVGFGDFVFRTACFPVDENGKTPIALSGTPEDPIVIIDLTALPPCGATRGAPTASEWGLIGLAASLLGLGVWALGRRREFAALPLP